MANIDPVGTPVEGFDPAGTNAGTEAGSTTVGAGIRGWLSTLAGIFQTVGGKVQGLGTFGTPTGGAMSVQGSVNPLYDAYTQEITLGNNPTAVSLHGRTSVALAIQRIPDTFKSFSALAIGSETTIWSPASGRRFRVMGYAITQGVLSGAITLKDGTAGTTILVIPQNTVGVVQVNPPFGNGILSATANNVLTATGSATETITGYVFGTEE